MREGPLVTLAEHFISKGMSLLVYDPEVHLSSLLGANRRFIEQHVPHIGSLVRSDNAEVIAGSEVLVIGLDDAQVAAALAKQVRPDQIIVDLVSLAARAGLPGTYEGLCWTREAGTHR